MSNKRSLIYLLAFSFLLLFMLTESCAGFNRVKANNNSIALGWLKPHLLNSERIKEKFGSYGVQVLLQDELSNVRLTNLYSEHNGEKVMRTLAFTRFELSMDKNLASAHDEILNGESIGETLKKHGFIVKKEAIYKGIVDQMPFQMRKMMKSNSNEFAAFIYNLSAIKGEISLPYCTITEIYSPDYLNVADLEILHQDTECVEHQENEKTGKIGAKENLMLIRAALGTL